MGRISLNGENEGGDFISQTNLITNENLNSSVILIQQALDFGGKEIYARYIEVHGKYNLNLNYFT